MAGPHEPTVPVATSDVRPLPNKLQAVYGELLPRTPLRFQLAEYSLISPSTMGRRLTYAHSESATSQRVAGDRLPNERYGRCAL
jgi:hypothetical protein